MLTDKQISLLAQPLIDTYSKVEMDLLLWIADKFNAYRYVGGDLEWKLTQLAKIGGLDQRAIEIIAQLNDIPFKQVYDAIEKAGIQSIDFKTYRKAFELDATNINIDNVIFDDVIQSVYGEVSSESRLVHQEISKNTLRAYNQVLNQINLETVTGIYDYNSSLNKALSKLADKGITAQTYYRKHKDKDGNEILIPVEYSIESVARRTIVSAIARSGNAHNEKVGKELGTEYWKTSQHLGARNKGQGHVNHESWQGKHYHIDEFEDKVGEGLVDGLGGANCRHIKFAYFPGISVDSEPIDTLENARVYDLEQKQRLLERQVRNAKKEYEIAKQSGDDEYIDKTRKNVRDKQSKLKTYVNNHEELRRDYNREKIQESLTPPYEDVTREWLKNVDTSANSTIETNDFSEIDGVRYDKNNAIIKNDIKAEEKDVATWLSDTFNEDVNFVPRVEAPQGISTPDFIFKGENWDLKSLTQSSKQTIYRSVNKKKKQSSNFIIDITKSGHDVTDAIKNVQDLFRRKDTAFISKIILKKDSDLIAVIQKKKTLPRR